MFVLFESRVTIVSSACLIETVALRPCVVVVIPALLTAVILPLTPDVTPVNMPSVVSNPPES